MAGGEKGGKKETFPLILDPHPPAKKEGRKKAEVDSSPTGVEPKRKERERDQVLLNLPRLIPCEKGEKKERKEAKTINDMPRTHARRIRRGLLPRFTEGGERSHTVLILFSRVLEKKAAAGLSRGSAFAGR